MTVTIVFKEPHDRATYHMSEEELKRLAKEFKESASTSYTGPKIGVYDAQTEKGDPRKLCVRFADILYIG